MFQNPAAARPGDDRPEALDAPPRRHAGLGPSVARICSALSAGDVMVIAASEQRAAAIAAAAAALAPARVLYFPPSDVLAGEATSALAVTGRRVAALSALHERRERPLLFVTDAGAATAKVAPPREFASSPLLLSAGDPLDGSDLSERLERLGYLADERVDEPGEMAVRGAAVDIFPPDADRPMRIHMEEGRIARISAFDPVTQLSTGDEIAQLALRPAAEPVAGSEAVPLFEHLPEATLLIDPEAPNGRDRFLDLASDAGSSIPLVDRGTWDEALKGRRLQVLADAGERPGRRFVEERRPDRAFIAALKEARAAGERVVIAGSERDLRFFSRRIEQRIGEAPRPVRHWSEVEAAAPGDLLAIVAELGRGWSEAGLSVIATEDVLGARARQAGAAAAVDPLAGEADFHIGDAVLHEEHGLGLLRGVEPVSSGDLLGDAIRLEYAGGAQRLVTVEDIHRLWRYGGDAEAVSLDRLDGSSWLKRRAEIDAGIADTARRLVAMAAERAARSAPVIDPPVAEYERFAAGFAFAETADQMRAIEGVRADLASGKPMDRLVVGDVGYGKTEIALRAAALAALAGRQVALIAPTTVLVRQHLDTFRRRFARLGIAVAGLSRLSSPAEQRAVRKGLADGSIRIVVGTRMVAGKAVRIPDLALVVIDEEQRFGAADKANLRALSEGSHVLTLTATPIPRTLQSALVGLQDLSLITTPPARRLPTRTQIAHFTAELVRPALLREKSRGGQSFVVVPRIEDMAPVADRLARLVPNLRIRQAHGKMPAVEIDEEMIGFSAGEGDILLATNIIESGLDIPRANTMLVCRADRFGLAQLHQLRGRVGRGGRRGSLLLLTEPGAEIAPATLKRLRTMEALDQLGAGFAISARDLDLRGAGKLLGEEQSGHAALIGLGLYQHLLGQAVRAARGEKVDDWTPELHLGLGGSLPAEWIPEEEVRINLYARISRIASRAEFDSLAQELEDRFGTVPEEAQTLIALAGIRRLARIAGIVRIDAGPAAIALTPRPGWSIDAAAAGLEPKGERLLLREETAADRSRLERVETLLDDLAAAG